MHTVRTEDVSATELLCLGEPELGRWEGCASFENRQKNSQLLDVFSIVFWDWWKGLVGGYKEPRTGSCEAVNA